MTPLWPKKLIMWREGADGPLCISVVFSWHVAEAVAVAKRFAGKVLVGGPAAILNREAFAGVADVLDEWAGVKQPLERHNPNATFTTRGCPNHCPFCAVPTIEGAFRELPFFDAAPIVCDNNFLAASVQHQERVIETLRMFPVVDFNQGLEARRFDKAAAGRLSRLRSVHVRFAWDMMPAETAVADAVRLAQKIVGPKVSVYVLIGFCDTLDDALYRLRSVIEWGATPFPMRYQPLRAAVKNDYVAPAWTDAELKRVCRFYSRRYFWHGPIPFADFNSEHAELDQGRLALTEPAERFPRERV